MWNVFEQIKNVIENHIQVSAFRQLFNVVQILIDTPL